MAVYERGFGGSTPPRKYFIVIKFNLFPFHSMLFLPYQLSTSTSLQNLTIGSQIV